MADDRRQHWAWARIDRVWRRVLMGILVGAVSGGGAILFSILIKEGTRFFLRDLPGFLVPVWAQEWFFLGIPVSTWLVFWIPALGGLLSGLIVFRFAPEAEGHGTDAMIDSFHQKGGFIRKRIPFVKAIASAITIGSGGSAGKEGPIAQIGSGFGSFLASSCGLGERERRVLILAGAAGGIGAIFKAPLGAALFATEVLYREPEFEFEAMIPCLLSSIIGYMVFTLYDGWGTLFKIPSLIPALAPSELLIYGGFGLLCAGVGFIYIRCFYGLRDHFFGKLRMARPLKTALGGALVGGMALFLPQVLGGGYEWMQSAVDGKFTPVMMLILAFSKIAATSFTISSGGSGGVFAPSLYIGAMLGGFYGGICATLFPDLLINPAAFVLVGMGGFFAGVAKVPIAALIMVAEMTGGYALMVPLMIVSTVSYLLLGKTSLYEKQVASRVASPAHLGDFAVDLLEHIRVQESLPRGRTVETIFEGTPFEEVLDRILVSDQSSFPVVNAAGRLRGILSQGDARRVLVQKELHRMVIAHDMATSRVVTVTPEDNLHLALERMVSAEIQEIPVVSSREPDRVLAMLSRKDILRLYHERLEALQERRRVSSE